MRNRMLTWIFDVVKIWSRVQETWGHECDCGSRQEEYAFACWWTSACINWRRQMYLCIAAQVFVVLVIAVGVYVGSNKDNVHWFSWFFSVYWLYVCVCMGVCTSCCRMYSRPYYCLDVQKRASAKAREKKPPEY